MTTDTTRRRLIKGAAAIGAAAAVPSTVSADHGGSDSAFFDGQATIVEENSYADQVLAFATGLQSRVTLGMKTRDDATSLGDEIQDHFNARSKDYRTWVNDRGKGNSDHQVFELRLIQGNSDDYRYLVTDYDADAEAYTSAEMMDQSTFENTGRSIDIHSELSGGAAASAPEELRNFYGEFVAPNRDLTKSYKSKMAGKYGENPHVTSDLLGDEL